MLRSYYVELAVRIKITRSQQLGNLRNLYYNGVGQKPCRRGSAMFFRTASGDCFRRVRVDRVNVSAIERQKAARRSAITADQILRPVSIEITGCDCERAGLALEQRLS